MATAEPVKKDAQKEPAVVAAASTATTAGGTVRVPSATDDNIV